MKAETKHNIERILEGFDEDELRVHAKIYHPRALKIYLETEALPMIVIANLGIQLEEAGKFIQQTARKIIAKRKTRELREDIARAKARLQRNLKLFEKLKPKIKIVSRKRAMVTLHDDGSFTWRCPSFWTDDVGKDHKCQEALRISMVEEKTHQAGFLAMTSNYIAEVGEGFPKRIATRELGGRMEISGLAQPGGETIIESLANGNEVFFVMRCLKCNTSDDLKFSIKAI